MNFENSLLFAPRAPPNGYCESCEVRGPLCEFPGGHFPFLPVRAVSGRPEIPSTPRGFWLAGDVEDRKFMPPRRHAIRGLENPCRRAGTKFGKSEFHAGRTFRSEPKALVPTVSRGCTKLATATAAWIPSPSPPAPPLLPSSDLRYLPRTAVYIYKVGGAAAATRSVTVIPPGEAHAASPFFHEFHLI